MMVTGLAAATKNDKVSWITGRDHQARLEKRRHKQQTFWCS
ncbi:unnamed protein product [Leptidea sinapis]|uniref:Uncharacterized protein n=1 Tax=Leptidea sinapis TaxID=189913 RepID=A0A5E4QXH0_9NEOP|nr:unnamed protein product [Leptidea sinapis]